MQLCAGHPGSSGHARHLLGQLGEEMRLARLKLLMLHCRRTHARRAAVAAMAVNPLVMSPRLRCNPRKRAF